MTKIDYQKIDVEQFLQELGMRNVKPDGNEIFFSCPFSGHTHGDLNPSASMQKLTTKVHCFGCGFNGNALTFLAEYENCSPVKAARYIREWLGDDFREPEGSFLTEIEEQYFSKKKNKIIVRNQPINLKELEKRKVNWKKRFIEEDYLLSRNFSPKTLSDWNIGWDEISRRYTIPYFDGPDLIGFKGRALPDEIGPEQPRYKVIGGPEYGFDSFDVSLFLFGIDHIDDWKNPFLPNHVIICEGELNVLALWQMGIGPAVGISGKHLSDAQVYLIRKTGKRPVIFFDELSDAAKAAEKLIRYTPTSVVPEHEIDAAEYMRIGLGSAVKRLIDGRISAILYEPLKQP